MQKPSLGRIVLATVDPKTNNGADVAPAIIVRVFSDTIINVHVLLDGHTTAWRTSISLYEDREALDAAAVTQREALGNPDGFVMHAAYWPPRV